MQDSTSGQNPNANFFQPGQGGNPNGAGTAPIGAPPVPTTTDASALGGSSLSLNPAPTPSTNGVSDNVGTAIPKAEDIVNQGAAPTPAEQQQTTLLQKVAALIGGNKTQTTLTNEAETAAGVPGMTSTVNDLNTQLEGLNNQATALQNEANYTIPNATQNSVEGKGVTSAGLAPITASQLRANQIKQGTIATQSLTVKSAIFGAQGKLSLAKDAADKAATAQYEQEQQQIDAYKAQLDALAPTLSKQEKAQAAIVQSQLQDRQTQIDNAKEDKKSIIILATAALTNNPNDPVAQYAAQQALAESNKSQPDLQKALSLVVKYQKDPAQVQKDIDAHLLYRAQIGNQNASAAKTLAEIKALGTGGTGGVSSELTAAINAGTIDPNKINSRTLGIYNAIAQAGVDAVGAHAGAAGETKAVTDLSAYKSTATRTLGILDKNLPLVTNLADKVNTLGVPGLDDYIRGIKSYTGNNPDVIKYVNSIKTLRSEYAQMLSKGSVATEGDKRDAEQAIPAGLSSAGYSALGEQLKLEANNIISASNDAISAAKNKSASNNGTPTGGSTYNGITLPN